MSSWGLRRFFQLFITEIDFRQCFNIVRRICRRRNNISSQVVRHLYLRAALSTLLTYVFGHPPFGSRCSGEPKCNEAGPYQITSFDTALFCATGDRRINQIDGPGVAPFDTTRSEQFLSAPRLRLKRRHT